MRQGFHLPLGKVSLCYKGHPDYWCCKSHSSSMGRVAHQPNDMTEQRNGEAQVGKGVDVKMIVKVGSVV